jgi:hypothetical protein
VEIAVMPSRTARNMRKPTDAVFAIGPPQILRSANPHP